MNKQAMNEMDYEQIIEEIIQIMVKYGATHKDAGEIMYRCSQTLKRQKITAERD